MKKLLCILFTLAFVFSSLSMITVSATEAVNNVDTSATFTLAPDNLLTPGVDRVVENGDAEDGLNNWDAMYGSALIQLVSDPENEENQVIEFVPGNTCPYETVAFDISAAILKDSAQGYNGSGAGRYTVSFRARAEEGKNGTFTGYIHSPFHYKSGDEYNGYTLTRDTYKSGTSFEMTDEWTDFSYSVDITEEWLNNIYTCYSLGASDAYTLNIRLDGCNKAFENGNFGYYIDDVTVVWSQLSAVTPEPTATPTAAPEKKGIKLTAADKLFVPGYYATKEGVFEAEPTFTGRKTVEYVVYNTSDKVLSIAYGLQVTHKGNGGGSFWSSPEAMTQAKIPANSKATLSYSFNVKNGLVSVISQGVSSEYSLDKLFVRFNPMFLNATGGSDSFIIASKGADDIIYQQQDREDFFVSEVYELPDLEEAQDVISPPVSEDLGIYFSATGVVVGEDKLYFKTGTGLIDETDISEGKVTKSYLVQTKSVNPINVKLELQALVEPVWVGQTDGEYVTLNRFESKILTYTMNVNQDNTVTVKGTDVPLDQFFIRFDIENENNEKKADSSFAFNIYPLEDDYDDVCRLKAGYPDGWFADKVHVLPVVDGWVKDRNDKYFLFEGEVLCDTWWFDETGYFYLGSDGILVKNSWIIDEEGLLYVDESGYLVTDCWIQVAEGFLYVNENGYLVTESWVQDENGWCYVDENGYKVTSTWKLDSVGWCYLTDDGTMATNEWILDSVGWCYVGSDGYCITNSWMQDSVGWCYLDSEGRMATNEWILDSVGWCYVGEDGYCVTNSWMADSVGWVYLDSEGRMATNQWIMDSVGWCYVGSDGYAMTNCWMADSIGWCYLDANGRMVVNDYVYDSNGKCWLDANGYWDGIYY